MSQTGAPDDRLSSIASAIACGMGTLSWVGTACSILLILLALPPAVSAAGKETLPKASPVALTRLDNDLLDDVSRRSFRYFWEQANPQTGLVLDRALTDGEPDDSSEHRDVASIAATGFGLTAVSIAAQHRWISRDLARDRVLTTLRFFAVSAPQEHGWFYHFMDARTGARVWNCEVSSIDTALLLAGMLTARQAFQDDPDIVRLAGFIYDRVDFPWMLDGSQTVLRHGWKPETGFLRSRWDTYSELMILYLLAIGSPTHPISPAAWYAWKLPVAEMGNYTFVGGGPLFIQQYSQAYVDLRHRIVEPTVPVDTFVPRVNYFANAVAATRAQQALAVDLSHQFPGYSPEVWGITASDSSRGYVAWGTSAKDPRIDGTVVPSAAGGSVMFAPDLCIPALRTMLVRYGRKIYGRYGFADAFNPSSGWVSRYVIGIDAGITMLSAENVRTGDVWRWFMSAPEANRALDLVGLVQDPSYDPEEEAKSNSDTSHAGDPKAANVEVTPQIPVMWNAELPPSSRDFKMPLYSRQPQ